MRRDRSLSADYFECMFRDNSDPWSFETSAYEKEKFTRTVDALGQRHFAHALEIGCANGVLTARLASQVDALLAIDVSATALALAAKRCRALPHVAFSEMAFPVQAPDPATFDCVILSEVAYYWDDADLARAGAWLACLPSRACILLVHYILETDYPQSGDDAVTILHDLLGSTVKVEQEERFEQYRLDRWSKV